MAGHDVPGKATAGNWPLVTRWEGVGALDGPRIMALACREPVPWAVTLTGLLSPPAVVGHSGCSWVVLSSRSVRL